MQMELLCHFVHKWRLFRIPELESVASLYNLPLTYNSSEAALINLDHECFPHSDREQHLRAESCFLHVTLQNVEAAQKIAARALLVKNFIEVWGSGGEWSAFGRSLSETFGDPEFHAKVEALLTDDCTYKIQVIPFGKTLSTAEQVALMNEHLTALPWRGKVDLKKPQIVFCLVLDYGIVLTEQPERQPKHIYFGLRVAEGRGMTDVQKYALPQRKFLGPTSMDHELSWIIANQAHAEEGRLVMDSFCGTGSILIGCAHHGAHVMGSDIDRRMIAGGLRKQTTKPLDNFIQYGFAYRLVDLIVADNAVSCWRGDLQVDALVADPPYGIRASSKQMNEAPGMGDVPAEHKAKHCPRTTQYAFNAMLDQLLSGAAKTLCTGGRLVFLMPTTVPSAKDGDPSLRVTPPQHPALLLISDSEQPINTKWSRRLMTYEKVGEYHHSQQVVFADPEIYDVHKILTNQWKGHSQGHQTSSKATGSQASSQTNPEGSTTTDSTESVEHKKFKPDESNQDEQLSHS